MSSIAPTVDLNCDLGEGFGRYTLGCDDEVIPLVSSVNVACGMHAGDPLTMSATVQRAADAGVAIGAHPGYPDLQGFGRRDMALSPDEVYAFTLYQLGALSAFAHASGALLHHVKPHGQLYNRAAKDAACAQAIAQAVKGFDPSLVLVGLAGGALVRAGEEAGLRVANEFFADRAYGDDGRLVPRTQPGALVTDVDEAVRRTVRAVSEGLVMTRDGRDIEVCAQTVCLHGDGPHALAFARRLREGLEEAGIVIRPLYSKTHNCHDAQSDDLHTIYLAGGCFWGLEAFLRQLPGVRNTEVGYANGTTPNPSYAEVCYGGTGHAETVKAVYDPQVLPTDVLLQGFFSVIDPTAVNRQGNDVGTQYRSGVYWADPTDETVVRAALTKLQTAHYRPLAIEAGPIQGFYPAEDYHQDYLSKNPGGYCHIRPGAAQAFVEQAGLAEGRPYRGGGKG